MDVNRLLVLIRGIPGVVERFGDWLAPTAKAEYSFPGTLPSTGAGMSTHR